MSEEFKKSFDNYQQIKNSVFKNAGIMAWFLGRHAFLIILLLCLLSISFGGFLILRHISLLNRESETINTPVKFREDLYQSVLNARNIREDFLKTPSKKIYTDPFQ